MGGGRGGDGSGPTTLQGRAGGEAELGVESLVLGRVGALSEPPDLRPECKSWVWREWFPLFLTCSLHIKQWSTTSPLTGLPNRNKHKSGA